MYSNHLPSSISACKRRTYRALILLFGFVLLWSFATANEISMWESDGEREEDMNGQYKRIVFDPTSSTPQPTTWRRKTSLFPIVQSPTASSNVNDNLNSLKKPSDFPLANRKINYDKTCRKSQNSIELKIIPPELQFLHRPLCIPATESIKVINLSEKESLYLFSIETDSVHFHSPAFTKKVLSPGENTTILLVFLPRILGDVESSIVIKTSFGDIVYHVGGQAIPNPFKLSPITGIKVPINVGFHPPLLIYNPYPHNLQIMEIYTHGGFLHLGLPPKSAGNTSLWVIEPYSTKEIVEVQFSSSTAGKFQGYVVIITDQNELSIMVHVEVLVVKGGTHSLPEEIDFGTITSLNERKDVPLRILNGENQAIKILDIQPVVLEKCLTTTFTPVVVIPNTESVVGVISWTAKSKGQFKGKILLKTNDSNAESSQLEVPYKVRVIPGSLEYNFIDTTFSVAAPQSDKFICNFYDDECLKSRVFSAEYLNVIEYLPNRKEITLTNLFTVPIAIYSSRIDDKHFSVLNTTSTIMNENSNLPLLIEFLPDSPDLMYTLNLEIISNITTHFIPLHVYTGKLNFSTTNDARGVDFGVVGLNETRNMNINITNMNPVRIPIYAVLLEVNGVEVIFDKILDNLGCTYEFRVLEWTIHQGLKFAINNKAPNEPLFYLEPGYSAIFSVSLLSTVEEQKVSYMRIFSPFEILSIPMRYQAIRGSVQFFPEEILLNASFPGKVVSATIYGYSTYSTQIEVLSLTSADPRINTFLNLFKLSTNETKPIGVISFDPNTFLISSPTHDRFTNEEHYVLKSEDLPTTDPSQTEYVINSTIIVTTEVQSQFPLSIRIITVKASIIPETNLTLFFGPTTINSISGKMIPMINPTDFPVFVQLVPHEQPPRASLTDVPIFIFPPTVLGGMVVEPRSSIFLGPVIFSPKSLNYVNTTIYLKNNLTVLEAVKIEGWGVNPCFHITLVNNENRQGEVHLEDSIYFDLNSSEINYILQECTSSKQSSGDPLSKRKSISVIRQITLSNCGQLALKIKDMGVDGLRCAGHGFHIQNCKTHLLKSDEALNLTIVFQPDFSSTSLHHHFYIETTNSYHNFPLTAEIPKELLSNCYATQEDKTYFTYHTTAHLCLLGLSIFTFFVMSQTLRSGTPLNQTEYVIQTESTSTSSLISPGYTNQNPFTPFTTPSPLPANTGGFGEGDKRKVKYKEKDKEKDKEKGKSGRDIETEKSGFDTEDLDVQQLINEEMKIMASENSAKNPKDGKEGKDSKENIRSEAGNDPKQDEEKVKAIANRTKKATNLPNQPNDSTSKHSPAKSKDKSNQKVKSSVPIQNPTVILKTTTQIQTVTPPTSSSKQTKPTSPSSPPVQPPKPQNAPRTGPPSNPNPPTSLDDSTVPIQMQIHIQNDITCQISPPGTPSETLKDSPSTIPEVSSPRANPTDSSNLINDITCKTSISNNINSQLSINIVNNTKRSNNVSLEEIGSIPDINSQRRANNPSYKPNVNIPPGGNERRSDFEQSLYPPEQLWNGQEPPKVVHSKMPPQHIERPKSAVIQNIIPKEKKNEEIGMLKKGQKMSRSSVVLPIPLIENEKGSKRRGSLDDHKKTKDDAPKAARIPKNTPISQSSPPVSPRATPHKEEIYHDPASYPPSPAHYQDQEFNYSKPPTELKTKPRDVTPKLPPNREYQPPEDWSGILQLPISNFEHSYYTGTPITQYGPPVQSPQGITPRNIGYYGPYGAYPQPNPNQKLPNTAVYVKRPGGPPNRPPSDSPNPYVYSKPMENWKTEERNEQASYQKPMQTQTLPSYPKRPPVENPLPLSAELRPIQILPESPDTSTSLFSKPFFVSPTRFENSGSMNSNSPNSTDQDASGKTLFSPAFPTPIGSQRSTTPSNTPSGPSYDLFDNFALFRNFPTQSEEPSLNERVNFYAANKQRENHENVQYLDK